MRRIVTHAGIAYMYVLHSQVSIMLTQDTS